MTKVVCIESPPNDERIVIGDKYLYKLSNNGKYFKICNLNGNYIAWFSYEKRRHIFMNEDEYRDKKIDEICQT